VLIPTANKILPILVLLQLPLLQSLLNWPTSQKLLQAWGSPKENIHGQLVHVFIGQISFPCPANCMHNNIFKRLKKINRFLNSQTEHFQPTVDVLYAPPMESWCKRTNTPSSRSLVVHEERMRQWGQWVSSWFCSDTGFSERKGIQPGKKETHAINPPKSLPNGVKEENQEGTDWHRFSWKTTAVFWLVM